MRLSKERGVSIRVQISSLQGWGFWLKRISRGPAGNCSSGQIRLTSSFLTVPARLTLPRMVADFSPSLPLHYFSDFFLTWQRNWRTLICFSFLSKKNRILLNLQFQSIILASSSNHIMSASLITYFEVKWILELDCLISKFSNWVIKIKKYISLE